MSRHVELEVHKGINVVTRKEQTFNQYMIHVCEGEDRDCVGLIGFGEDCKVIFTKVIDPVTAKWVKGEVDKILDRDVELVDCPDIPKDLLDNPGIQFDEFDEEELTG